MPNELETLAAHALELVSDGMRLGLGSGRAAETFVRALGERVRSGFRVRGVPTSEASAALARSLGIPLDPLDQPLDLTVDGADEVERSTLNLVKGWGGALVRERIVAAASSRQVILVTAEKMVDRLGSRGRLPVEVLPFAEPFVRRRLEAMGGLKPALRQVDGKPFVSDNGNWILDVGLSPPADAAALDGALRAVPGVIDTGFFFGTASVVLLAEGGAVRALQRG